MLHLTASAERHFAHHRNRIGGASWVRVFLRRTGCSGWACTAECVGTLREDDLPVTEDGSVVVPRSQIARLDGTRIDVVSHALGHRVVFAIPGTTGTCGCGESVALAEPVRSGGAPNGPDDPPTPP